jgi:hypothetical protein
LLLPLLVLLGGETGLLEVRNDGIRHHCQW